MTETRWKQVLVCPKETISREEGEMREDEEDGGVVSRDENRPDKKYRKYSTIISQILQILERARNATEQ